MSDRFSVVEVTYLDRHKEIGLARYMGRTVWAPNGWFTSPNLTEGTAISVIELHKYTIDDLLDRTVSVEQPEIVYAVAK